jgi:hypothetical protein
LRSPPTVSTLWEGYANAAPSLLSAASVGRDFLMAKTKKQPVENPDLLQLGQKARAGQLLSSYLRAIGTEVTEVMQDDAPKGCPKGPPRLMSKAERLARHIWQMALPRTDDDGTRHEPMFEYVRLVLDRVEGKAGTMEAEKESGRESVPDKVSRLGVEKLNKIAEGSVE